MIRRLLGALPLLATLGALFWAMQSNPLAVPFVARTQADLALTLERAVRREATTEWLTTALAEATAAADVDRAEMLIDLSQGLDRDVDTGEAEAMIVDTGGVVATARDCGVCMADITACPTLPLLTFCAAPFELSPLGDLNALRRASMDAATGQDVDELDAGLALVGLAATGAVLVTGGSSATVKAGATLLRMARRIGSVTPGLARILRVPIHWERVPDVLSGTARVGDLTDAAALARIGGVAADLGRMRAATSTAEALRLTRLVDTPEDAARLARVAEAAGPRTTRTVAVLGKGRVMRATVRLSRAAAGTLALLWLTAVQLAVVVGTRMGALALRGLARTV